MNGIALVRRPPRALALGERTFVPARPVDAEVALLQHDGYVRSLVELGLEVRALPELEEHPDGAFVEDAAVVLDEIAVIARQGAESRRGETASVAQALEPLRELVHLEEPCTLDGGDVLRVGDTLLVGQSTRTNHAALRRLAHVVLEHGLLVKAVEVEGCLHLKTAATWLGDDFLLANPAWMNMARMPRLDVIEVDPREPFAANALAIDGVVLFPSSFPRTAERIASRGFEVKPLDLSEFLKAEAGPTCLSLLVR